MPLGQAEVSKIMRDWENQGYNTEGFELEPTNQFAEAGNYSQSRREWPTWDDIASERKTRTYQVTLPDLNGEIPPAAVMDTLEGHVLTRRCL
jgi:hypothetical protein